MRSIHPETPATETQRPKISGSGLAFALCTVCFCGAFCIITASQALSADSPATQPTSLAARVGKPLQLAGRTFDGKDFSTDQWKGHVILVDFWATWCGPCVKELPAVQKIYDQYHAKGLEVIGISSDYKPELLTKFLAAHPEYAWPQLFDPKAAKDEEMHPLTATLGIEASPVMILIDKQGICRSVTGATEMETMIPKLLGE
jgi:thiol-disulfide isomerase/thioredoxin